MGAGAHEEVGAACGGSGTVGRVGPYDRGMTGIGLGAAGGGGV